MLPVASFSSTSSFYLRRLGQHHRQHLRHAVHLSPPPIPLSPLSIAATSGKLVATGKTGTITDTTALTTGQWYLVAITFDGTNLRLYKDGVSGGISYRDAPPPPAPPPSTSAATKAWRVASTAPSTMSVITPAALNGTVTPISTITQMQWLYNEFGPLVNFINPSSWTKQTSTTTKLSTFAIDHANSTAVNRVVPADLIFTWSIYSFDGTVGATGGATFPTGARQPAPMPPAPSPSPGVLPVLTSSNSSSPTTSATPPPSIIP